MNLRSSLTAVGLVAAGAALVACQPAEHTQREEGAAEGTAAEGSAAGQVVEITAVDYAFDAPDTIPSGWVTFRMKNQGKETHYFQINRLRLPEGRTFADFEEAALEPADSLRQLRDAGRIDSAEVRKALDEIVPDWVPDSGVLGGKGGGMPLLAPDRTARATHKMEPGVYVMRCVAVKSPEGLSHARLGMEHGITVTKASTGASPPEPDVTMRVSGHDVTVEGQFRAGRQTGAYHVEEASAEMDDYYWSAMLARIESDADVGKLRAWIEEGEYRNPVPVEYVGGFEYLSPGDTAYAELDLAPGRYAWHVHGEQDTVWTFTVE